MKFQEQLTTYPYTNTPILPKQSFTSNENFNTKLPRFIKQISLKYNLNQQNLNQAFNIPQIHSIKFDTQKNIIRSNLSTILETDSKMYLFLVRSVLQGYSELVLFEYIKQNGDKKSMELSGIKGEITSIKAKFCKKVKMPNSYSQPASNKSQRKGHSSKSISSQFQVTLFLGTTTGYFKILRFSKNQQLQNSTFNNSTIQNQLYIQSLELQKSQISFIHVLDPEYYHNANLSLVQTLSNKVYLINFDIMEILSIFYPTIISCQIGLSLSINDVGKYFIQCTEGGYIIFWEFNENVIKAIKKSTEIKDDKEKQNQIYQGVTKQEKQSVRNHNTQNIIQNPKNYSNFQSKNLVHCINPLKIFHSATIYGLKFCQLYGNLILLITQQGVLKILAVNNSSINTLNDNQYCMLLEYKIDYGELIIDAKFFPKTREVFIVKSELYKSINKQNSQEIPLKPFKIDSLTTNSTKKIPKPYQPNQLKTIRNNAHLDQAPSSSLLSQPNSNHISKLIPVHNPPSSSICYFERIIFNSQLQIQRVDKIFPNQQITAIQSLQIVQQKDIFILRGKQFYLAGVMDNFVEDR